MKHIFPKDLQMPIIAGISRLSSIRLEFCPRHFERENLRNGLLLQVYCRLCSRNSHWMPHPGFGEIEHGFRPKPVLFRPLSFEGINLPSKRLVVHWRGLCQHMAKDGNLACCGALSVEEIELN